MDNFWNRRRKKRKKEIREKKDINNRLIKDRILRKFIINPKKQVISGIIITLNMKVIVIKIGNLPLDDYLHKIKLCLRNIIIDLHCS